MTVNDYSEAQMLLAEALRIRRKYISGSLQDFCHTTSAILDGKEPPSFEFCVHITHEGKLKVTPGGDIVSGTITSSISVWPFLKFSR